MVDMVQTVGDILAWQDMLVLLLVVEGILSQVLVQMQGMELDHLALVELQHTLAWSQVGKLQEEQKTLKEDKTFLKHCLIFLLDR